MKIKKMSILLPVLGVLAIVDNTQGAIALLDEFNGPAGPPIPTVNEWNGNAVVDGSGSAVYTTTGTNLAARFFDFGEFDTLYQPMTFTVTSQSSPHGFFGYDAVSPYAGRILFRPDLNELQSRGPGGIDRVPFDAKSLTGPYTVDIIWTPTLVEISVDGFVEYSTTDPAFIPTDPLRPWFQTYDVSGTGGPDAGTMLLDRVQVGTALPGDFDFDNKVDGMDFLVWQRDLGDAANLALWESNYGATAAQAVVAAVPEPATLNILALGLLAFVLKGRHHRIAGKRCLILCVKEARPRAAGPGRSPGLGLI